MSDVFISYSHDSDQDRQVAQAIKESLERHGVSSFWDESDIPAGGNWAKQLSSALESARAMVVLVSPRASKSAWVRRDIDFALTAPNLAGRIVPVIVKPTTGLPWILDTLQHIVVGSNPRKAANEVAELLKAKLAATPRFSRRAVAGARKHRKAASQKTSA